MNKTEYKDGGNIIDFNPNHVPSKRNINYAKKIKDKYPKIWDLGGNIFGNEAFVNLERVSKRGYWLESEEWMYIKWRSYVARHQHDFRINGVIAMLKWADNVNKGWAYMKDLIEAKIEKQGWKTNKTIRMKQGGNVKSYSFVESTTTDGQKIFKIFDFVPTHKEVFDYYKNSKQKNKEGVEIVDSNIKIETFTNFDSAEFLKQANKVAIKEFKSPIDFNKSDLMFKFDKINLQVYPFDAKLKDATNVEISVIDGVIFMKPTQNKTTRLKQGGEVKLLAPNGKPTNLTPEQYKLVRTESFKKWFGDWENDPKNSSKVIDENGEPLVVYHGTTTEFTVFDKLKQNKATGFGDFGAGFYFTANIDTAKYYTLKESENRRIISVFLKVFNPFIVEMNWEKLSEQTEINYKKLLGFHDWERDVIKDGLLEKNRPSKKITKDFGDYRFQEILSVNGYDGVFVHRINISEDKINLPDQILNFNELVVFEPNQIKLADGTNTTFDESNDDIRFENGGEIERYKEESILDLNFFPTNSEHAKEYGIKSKNPLFIQNLTVKEIDSLKNLDEYAKNNGHDVIFGHIIQKAKYSKDKQKSFFGDVEMIKNQLHNNGYSINQDNNDFHKVLTDKYYLVGDCIDYIQNSESIKNNGYYLNIKNMNNYVSSNSINIPKINSLYLITFNSDNQKDLKSVDTINSMLLATEIAELLNIDIEMAKIIVFEQTTHSKPFKMDMLDGIKNENIIVADRDKIVWTNLSMQLADGGEIKLLAPNGRPSNLTPEQYKLVRTESFKKWFGDWENDPKNSSKVVDENGEPLVVYHFTDKKFNVFEKKGLSNGFFFTENKKDKEFSYRGKPKSYFLSIKSMSEVSEVPNKYWSTPRYENEFIEMSKKGGGKGIQFIRESDNKRIIVAFEPNQIKLADETNTTFDESNDDIRFEHGGNMSKLTTKKDSDGNWVGKYLGCDFKLFNSREGWSFSIYYYSPMWESNTIYNSDIDFEAFKTKKSAINSVIEMIIDINETNDSFLKKRMKEGGEINNNNDIQSALKLIQKASDISDKNNYLNCDLFCHEMVDNRTFKKDFNIVPFKINTKKNFENQYNDLINVLEVGDIVAFGEKNNVRHYAIYIGNDDVLEVEMWGGKPRKFSLKTNLYNYENVPYIYREKNSSFIQGGNIDKQDSVTMNIPLLIRTLELAREDVKSDVELHHVVENLLKLKNKKVLTMDDYDYIAHVKSKHIEKMEDGGNLSDNIFDATKIDLDNPISSRVYFKGVNNQISQILKNDYEHIFDFDKKGIEWVYKNTIYNVKDENLIEELTDALAQRNRGVVDMMRINSQLPTIQAKYGKNVNFSKRMYQEAKDFYENKLRNEKSNRANEVFIDYLISRLKENKKQISIAKPDEIAEMNEAIETLNLLMETLPKEEHKEIEEAIEILKLLK